MYLPLLSDTVVGSYVPTCGRPPPLWNTATVTFDSGLVSSPPSRMTPEITYVELGGGAGDGVGGAGTGLGVGPGTGLGAGVGDGAAGPEELLEPPHEHVMTANATRQRRVVIRIDSSGYWNLDDHRNAHAAADAERRHTFPAASRAQRVDQRRQHAGAAGADWMAK